MNKLINNVLAIAHNFFSTFDKCTVLEETDSYTKRVAKGLSLSQRFILAILKDISFFLRVNFHSFPVSFHLKKSRE